MANNRVLCFFTYFEIFQHHNQSHFKITEVKVQNIGDFLEKLGYYVYMYTNICRFIVQKLDPRVFKKVRKSFIRDWILG